MNLTDKREVKKLLEWVAENDRESLLINDEKKESYWKTREREDTYIMPYDFRTIQEFEKMCDLIWGKEAAKEIQRTVSIAAFSSRADYERRHTQRESAMEKMPEYIYVF